MVILKIPENVNTIALKFRFAEGISFFVGEKDGKKIAVLQKTTPKYSYECCQHRYLIFELGMKLRGGIMLDEKNKKLKYAKMSNEEGYLVIEGYLVFERMNGVEWIVSNKDPEAFFHMIYYTIERADYSADYEIISNKNIYSIAKDREYNLGVSAAALGFLASAKEPSFLEYNKVDRYDGYREFIEKLKIIWNNGNPVVEPVEELKRVI